MINYCRRQYNYLLSRMGGVGRFPLPVGGPLTLYCLNNFWAKNPFMNQKVLFCSLECRFYTEKYRLFTKKSPVCTKNCPFSIKCRFSNVKCPFIKCPSQSKIHRAPHAKKNLLTFYFKNIYVHEYNCTPIFL